MPGGPSLRFATSTSSAAKAFRQPSTRTGPRAGLLPHFSTVPVYLNHPAWARENRSEGPMVAPQKSTPGRDSAEA